MGRRRTHESKKLSQELTHCMAVMEEAGLSIGNVEGICYKENVNSKWGDCRRHRGRDGDYIFSISISDRLEHVDSKKRENVILHELIHTIPGCFDHGRKFKAACLKINSLPYGYLVKTRSCSKDFGLDKGELPQNTKYVIYCRKCGKRVVCYTRACKIVKSPDQYRHKICGGDLYVVDVRENSNPHTPDCVANANSVNTKTEAKKSKPFVFSCEENGQLSFL